MPSTDKPRNDTRLMLLRMLADIDGDITAQELADRTGLAVWSVRQSLLRPTRCGRVIAIKPPQNGYGPMPRTQYSLTDKGRQYLAEVAAEEAENAEG
jgi:predicted ArsR family transcriptional regulator